MRRLPASGLGPVLAILVVLACPVLAKAGGPWPQGKGNAYVKLSEWWLRFDRHYTDAGRTDPNLTTSIYNTFLYGSFGINDRLTGIVNANVFGRNVMNALQSTVSGEVVVPGEALNHIGDIDLALKYTLTKPDAAWPASVTLLAGLPTGEDFGGTQGNLQTGDGEFNQMLRVDVARGFGFRQNSSAYVNAYAGFNQRTQGFSDEWRGGLEAGVNLLSRKLWVITRLDIVESLKNGETAATFTGSGIFSNNAEFTSLGLELNYYIRPKLGISVGAAGALRAELIAAAPSYSAGVFLDLR